MSLDVTLIPALQDNYVFLLHLPQEQQVVVDPAAAAPVQAALGETKLTAILLTHHHADHTAGVAELAARYGCPVYGNGADSKLPRGTLPLHEGETVPNLSVPITVMSTPGHTARHISYYLPTENALFCGDTLFVGGCGRLLGGTAGQLYESLQKINQLPAQTTIYCAHEYTVSNLRFAASLAPDLEAVNARLSWAEARRAQGVPTVPTTLAQERESNLFLQAATPESFAALRQAKDNFR